MVQVRTGKGRGWAHGVEPPLPCPASQAPLWVRMGGRTTKPDVRAAPWACMMSLCVTTGLGTPGCEAEPDALLGQPWGHAGDAVGFWGERHTLRGLAGSKGREGNVLRHQARRVRPVPPYHQCHPVTRELGQWAEAGWAQECHCAEWEGSVGLQREREYI